MNNHETIPVFRDEFHTTIKKKLLRYESRNLFSVWTSRGLENRRN